MNEGLCGILGEKGSDPGNIFEMEMAGLGKGLNVWFEREESRITPRHRTWGQEEIVVPSIDREIVGVVVIREGGKTISSVLEMLNLRKRWDIQEETVGNTSEERGGDVSGGKINVNIIRIKMILEVKRADELT